MITELPEDWQILLTDLRLHPELLDFVSRRYTSTMCINVKIDHYVDTGLHKYWSISGVCMSSNSIHHNLVNYFV